MKRIDKRNLVDQIGRELQSRMSYSDIKTYLSEFGVDTSKKTSSVNSKWVYVKELLADVEDDLILQLAEELTIDHGLGNPRGLDLRDSKFWIPGYFRLFLSHLSAYKVRTGQLRNVLREFGISGFVAHDDIEPTKEWQIEIQKALFSMDAFVAVLTPGFRESQWTDQEVGIAIGRNVLVVPVRKGLDPYGFIAKYQGLQGEGKTIGQVADALFDILAKHPKTRKKMADLLVDQILLSPNSDAGSKKLGLLRRVEALADGHLEKLARNVLRNEKLAESDAFVDAVNSLLKERNIPEVSLGRLDDELQGDEIPF